MPITAAEGSTLKAVGLLLLLAAACRQAPRAPLAEVSPNDNTGAAGTRHGDTLRLTLVAQPARWHPESDSGPSAEVVAFSEEGRAPRIPAPMIRVREGTVVDLTVRNALRDSMLKIVGLRTRPDTTHDTLRVRPGEAQHVTFAAGTPGTYSYWAVLGKHDPDVDEERETLTGAFIVDPKNGSPPDRVFVMNIWGVLKDSVTYGNALAINGRSWPYTERISAAVGDTLRWRVINGTVRAHPMHLHGFYFNVTSRGDPHADTVYAPDQRPTIVTERMRPGGSMLMTAVADRPGNWLFHCHISFHVIPGGATLETDSADAAHATMSPDAGRHMAGLVLGINVAPRPGEAPPSRAGARKLDLFVDKAPGAVTTRLGPWATSCSAVPRRRRATRWKRSAPCCC